MYSAGMLSPHRRTRRRATSPDGSPTPQAAGTVMPGDQRETVPSEVCVGRRSASLPDERRLLHSRRAEIVARTEYLTDDKKRAFVRATTQRAPSTRMLTRRALRTGRDGAPVRGVVPRGPTAPPDDPGLYARLTDCMR